MVIKGFNIEVGDKVYCNDPNFAGTTSFVQGGTHYTITCIDKFMGTPTLIRLKDVEGGFSTERLGRSWFPVKETLVTTHCKQWT